MIRWILIMVVEVFALVLLRLLLNFYTIPAEREVADDLIRRILWWGSRMPYLGDSQVANEIDYRTDTPLQSEIGYWMPGTMHTIWYFWNRF